MTTPTIFNDFKDTPLRFFVYVTSDDLETTEVSEPEFLTYRGDISYERHTVFENGVRQICLTKGKLAL